MRQRARTDLSGGTGATRLPTATEPGGGALARAYHVRMGVDARPRANPPLRFATPGHLAERCGRQRNAGINRQLADERVVVGVRA